MHYTINKKSVIIIFFLIIFFTFCSSALAFKISDGIDSTTNESFWGFQVGYFPNYTNSFNSDGISFLLLTESVSIKGINHGYYFTLYNQLNNKQLNSNNPTGSFSIGGYLNYPFFINNSSLIIRAGIGLGYPMVSLNFLNMFMIEYITPINKNMSLTFSILQEIVRFNFVLPIQINLGIRF